MKRALIFGIPLVALGVASWAAWQVQQLQPARTAAVNLMLPGKMPALNPFQPADESERQLIELLHQPLIRLDAQGRLAPGLADSWSWHQRLTCWFPTVEALQAAQKRMGGITDEQRQKWNLEEVAIEGLSLSLRFAMSGESGADEALQALAADGPSPLTFVRIESPPSGRVLLEEFSRLPAHAASTVRVWFDESGTCEMVTTRPLLQLREALAEWLFQKGQPVPRVTPFAEVTGLLEPLLDFEIGSDQTVWRDGAPLTAADVQATVGHVLSQGYPVPGAEGFRHIQDIRPVGRTSIRVVYRRTYGAALAGWAGLPILPETWLKRHPKEGDAPPPGAGEWEIASHTDRLLSLRTKIKTKEGMQESLQVIPATSSLQARVALATGAMDVVWPGAVDELRQEASLVFHATPPRNRLLVLWNVRSSRLSELPVREALALAVDREALAKDSPGGAARAAEVLFAPGLWFSPSPSSAPLDLNAARQRLEGAGWLKDVSGIAKKGGQGLEFELLVVTGSSWRESLARLLADQWAKLGVKVSVTLVSPENLVPDRLAPGRFDAVLVGLDYDLSWDQTAFWHSAPGQGGLNFSRLADPQLDLLLEALASEFDLAQVPARAQALQDRLQALQPVLPLIGDLQEMGLRKERFPHLSVPDANRPLTLRNLLRDDAQSLLRMRVPNE